MAVSQSPLGSYESYNAATCCLGWIGLKIAFRRCPYCLGACVGTMWWRCSRYGSLLSTHQRACRDHLQITKSGLWGRLYRRCWRFGGPEPFESEPRSFQPTNIRLKLRVIQVPPSPTITLPSLHHPPSHPSITHHHPPITLLSLSHPPSCLICHLATLSK